jgi:hypothetical protein
LASAGETTTDVGKLQAAAVKRNVIVMANMTMAFSTDGIMAPLVYEAMDEDWPCGLVHKVVRELKMKHQPWDTMPRVELQQILNMVAMKRNENLATNQCN